MHQEKRISMRSGGGKRRAKKNRNPNPPKQKTKKHNLIDWERVSLCNRCFRVPYPDGASSLDLHNTPCLTRNPSRTGSVRRRRSQVYQYHLTANISFCCHPLRRFTRRVDLVTEHASTSTSKRYSYTL